MGVEETEGLMGVETYFCRATPRRGSRQMYAGDGKEHRDTGNQNFQVG
jgi:hypothetical protein